MSFSKNWVKGKPTYNREKEGIGGKQRGRGKERRGEKGRERAREKERREGKEGEGGRRDVWNIL